MSSFNFAVAGALQPYGALPKIGEALRPVARVAKARRLDDHSTAADKLEFNLEQDTHSASPEQVAAKKYRQVQKPQQKQHRRAWSVADLMTTDVNTLNPDASVREAWDLHLRKGFRHLPIVDATGVIQGILSDRDLLQRAQGREMDQETAVRDIMTKKVLTCHADSSLRLAAAIMLQENFSALPVIDKAGLLKGILTTNDILQALVHESPLDLWV